MMVWSQTSRTCLKILVPQSLGQSSRISQSRSPTGGGAKHCNLCQHGRNASCATRESIEKAYRRPWEVSQFDITLKKGLSIHNWHWPSSTKMMVKLNWLQYNRGRSSKNWTPSSRMMCYSLELLYGGNSNSNSRTWIKNMTTHWICLTMSLIIALRCSKAQLMTLYGGLSPWCWRKRREADIIASHYFQQLLKSLLGDTLWPLKSHRRARVCIPIMGKVLSAITLNTRVYKAFIVFFLLNKILTITDKRYESR